jgi:hypothetical protein
MKYLAIVLMRSMTARASDTPKAVTSIAMIRVRR